MSSTFRNALGAVFVAMALIGCESVTSGGYRAPTETLVNAAAEAEAGNNYLTASIHYRTLLDRNPGNRDYLLGWARNMRYIGRANLVIEAMKKETGVDGGGAAVLIELGKAEIAASKAKDAVEHLKSALAAGGDNWDAYAALGIGYDLLQSYDEAWDAYTKALDLSPGNAQVLNNMALSAALSGKLDTAISILDGAPLPVRRIPQIRQNLAFFYGLKGDFKKAETLAKLDLDDAAVRNNLAVFDRFFTNPAKSAAGP